MLGDQGFELADELSVPAELELGRDQIFPGRRPLLLEAGDRYLGELLEREVGKRGASPQGQSLAEQICAPAGVFGLSRRRDETLEPVEVDAVRVHGEPVARRLSLHRLGSELLAERGDEILKRADRGLGRLSRPQLLDELVGGDDLSAMEQQQSQEGALLPPFQLERTPLHQHL